MADEKIRWGIISTARIGWTAFIPALRETADGEVVAVASRSRETGEAFAKEHGIETVFDSYDTLLESDVIDAVYNPLPNTLHAEWTIRAADQGKHVFCEKPMGVSEAEVRAMAEAAEKNGVHLVEAFVFLFHPQSHKLRSLLDEGTIGELRQMETHCSFRLPRDGQSNIRLNKDVGGGALLDAGSYPITFTRFAFGEEPVSVQAEVHTDPEHGVDARAAAILSFSGGRTATIQTGMDAPVGFGSVLFGSEGAIEVPQPYHPRVDAHLVVRSLGERPTVAEEVVRVSTEDEREPFTPALEHFNKCIKTGTSPAVSPLNAVGTIRVIDAIHASSERGERIAIPSGDASA